MHQRKQRPENRAVRRQARKKVEDRLVKERGWPRQRVKNFMKGKDVHHTNRGLELIDSKEHY